MENVSIINLPMLESYKKCKKLKKKEQNLNKQTLYNTLNQ